MWLSLCWSGSVTPSCPQVVRQNAREVCGAVKHTVDLLLSVALELRYEVMKLELLYIIQASTKICELRSEVMKLQLLYIIQASTKICEVLIEHLLIWIVWMSWIYLIIYFSMSMTLRTAMLS